MKTILTLDDLYSISEFLTENRFAEVPITITIDVLTEERMKTINKMLIDESNSDDDNENELDEINVTVSGVNFKYKLAKNDNNREK